MVEFAKYRGLSMNQVVLHAFLKIFLNTYSPTHKISIRMQE